MGASGAGELQVGRWTEAVEVEETGTNAEDKSTTPAISRLTGLYPLFIKTVRIVAIESTKVTEKFRRGRGFSIRTRAIAPPGQEGWLCHKENIAKQPLLAQTGWLFKLERNI
jgi:hypothetical protein